jgi:hypothetical protein
MSCYNLKIGWRTSRTNMYSGSMALQGLESQPSLRHLLKLCLQRGDLVQVSSAHETLRTGVIIQAILPTLAFQLAYQYTQYSRAVAPGLEGQIQMSGRSPSVCRWRNLLLAHSKLPSIPTLIIIDALDECKDIEPASAILSVLSRYVDEIPEVRFFITGRPEPRIRSGFRLELLRPVTEVLKTP